MAESYLDSLRRRAIHLVLVKNMPPHQAAKILQCTSRGVRRFVQEFLDQQPLPAPSAPAPSSFVPVTLTDSPRPVGVIPVRLTTATGLVLRFRLTTVQEIAELVHSLEVKPC